MDELREPVSCEPEADAFESDGSIVEDATGGTCAPGAAPSRKGGITSAPPAGWRFDVLVDVLGRTDGGFSGEAEPTARESCALVCTRA